ncbi:hypothetical protein AVEN_60362-1 [Araneus ventricosus]|uniref:Uncharacterized protein n=1 Tax=Araneus ventricosus TaxID=182803 RepID=A0A4Y2NQE5_ARAVE|nr:hypothetical protein AVEN_60362-1 [Araneus ventricosus]
MSQEQRRLSSSNTNYDVFSLPELNELENCITELRGTADYLDLYTSDDARDISRKFQQDEYRESEQSSFSLTKNEAYFSIMSDSNENAVFNYRLING